MRSGAGAEYVGARALANVRRTRYPPLVEETAPVPAAPDFAGLYDQAAPALFAWASLRIHRRYRAAIGPEDLVQEIWLRAYRSFSTYDPARSFRGWVFGVAKNVLFEVQRALHKREKEHGADGNTGRLEALGDVPDQASTITRRVARDDAVRAFVRQVEGLDEFDRKIVVHCGFEELTQREAAERLGIGYEAVAKRWQRLRTRLRDGAVGLASPD